MDLDQVTAVYELAYIESLQFGPPEHLGLEQ